MLGSPATLRRFLLQAAALSLGWLIVVLACGRLALIATNNRHNLYDFVQEWTSARNFLTGAPIYQSMDVSLPRYYPQVQVHGIKYNAHPPFSVLLCVPLGALDYRHAYLLWTLGSLLLTIVAVRLLASRHGLDLTAVPICGLTLLLVTSNAFEQQILQGQWNCVLLCLLTGAWLAGRHGHRGWSGAMIGIAGTVKLFPLFLLIYFAVRREWRAVATGIASFVLLNAFTAAVLGWDTYGTYFGFVTTCVSEFRDTWPNASLLGYWSKLFDGGFGHVQTVARLPLLARALTGISAAILVADLAVRIWRSDSVVQRDLAFALALVAMLLVSPITWDHYFVILALPVSILWRHAGATSLRVGLLAVVFLLCTVSPSRVWKLTLPGYAQAGETAALASPWMTVSLIAFQTYLLLGLYLLARSIWSRTARAASAQRVETGAALVDAPLGAQ